MTTANTSFNAETAMIPHNQLIISKKNQRKKKPSKKADAALIASIKALGVLQNLVVVPTEDGTGYEVAGGGRRHRLTGDIIAAGFFPVDYPMPCTIRAREDLEIITMAENLKEPIHAADNFESYKQLADAGYSKKEIAEAFGDSVKDVEKLLRLAKVEPSLIELFREDKMSLECVMAFTICDDHARQLACWEYLKNRTLFPNQIRQFLAQNTFEKNAPIVKFVTLAAYKKAGGAVDADLFEQSVYLKDVSLVRELATEKLQAYAATLDEGWNWVEVSAEGEEDYFTELDTVYVGVPPELQAEFDEADRLTDELDRDDENYDVAFENYQSLREKLSQYLAYSEEQKAFSGAVVTIDDDGVILVKRGMVKDDDYQKFRDWQAAQHSDDSDDAADEGDDPAPHSNTSEPAEKIAESNTLKNDLSNYLMQAYRASLLDHPELCLDLMTYDFAVKVLATGASSSERFVKVYVEGQRLEAVALDETAAYSKLTSAYAALSLEWLAIENREERLAAFIALSRDQKSAILTYCIASNTDARKLMPSAQQAYASSVTNFQLLDFWKPTYDNYYNRLTKADLVQLGIEKFGADWSKSAMNMKKGDVAKTLDGSQEFSSWLPPSMGSQQGHTVH